MSDPLASGDETIDAGKTCYFVDSVTALDVYIFKYDPTPEADGDIVAPACAGLTPAQLSPFAFDLDALDSTERSLAAIPLSPRRHPRPHATRPRPS